MGKHVRAQLIEQFDIFPVKVYIFLCVLCVCVCLFKKIQTQIVH